MDMFLAMLALFIGYIIGKLDKRPDKTIKSTSTITKAKPLRHENHIEPEYYGYDGNYWNINKCVECDLVGMYEDLHTTSPCRRCGAKVKRNGSARWENNNGVKQWVKSKHSR